MTNYEYTRRSNMPSALIGASDEVQTAFWCTDDREYDMDYIRDILKGGKVPDEWLEPIKAQLLKWELMA